MVCNAIPTCSSSPENQQMSRVKLENNKSVRLPPFCSFQDLPVALHQVVDENVKARRPDCFT